MKLTIKDDGDYWKLRWEDYTPPKKNEHITIDGMEVDYNRPGLVGIAVSNVNQMIIVGENKGSPSIEMGTQKEFQGRHISREDIRSIIKTLYK